MKKVLTFSLTVLLSGCGSQQLLPERIDEIASTEVVDEIILQEPVEVSPDNMSLVLESSGLVPENVSTSFPESAELEQALKNMLSRLVQSSEVSSSEGGGWVKGVYHVKKGDTLSAIARDSVKDTQIRSDFILDTIVKLNPSAFIRGNPNWMLAGSKLRFPKAEDFGRLFFVKSELVKSPAEVVDPFLGWIQYP
jgi:Tfp pilus assembly protein FimV